MLLRQDGDDVIAITQPAHAWLSGQLARAWGNERFSRPEPWAEVCLGAEQHDIGWLEWETAPTLNPKTGLPHVFHELRAELHTALWRRGVELARAYGLYPALLVSLHANTIYGNFFDFEKAAPEDAALVRAFLEEQRDFQTLVTGRLRSDPHHAAHGIPERIEHNRLLVGAVDRISLDICWGVDETRTVPDVPSTPGERVGVEISPLGDGARTLSMRPWPFASDRVGLVVAGRRLRGRFSDEGAMREKLQRAPAMTIETVLVPA